MKKFTFKEGSNPNYIATITKVGEIHPIEGADKICRTVVNGFDIVVGKDTKEGDIVVYVPVETAICDKFLSANNLYEIGEWERNANAAEVGVLLAKVEELKNEGKHDEAENVYKEAKALVGYFNARNRVRIVTLKGIPSNGFVASVQSLVKYDSELANVDWESLVGTQFNYIDDEEFCHKYVPVIKEHSEKNTQKHFNKRMKKVKKFDRLIDDQFVFHYDTVRVDATNFKKSLKPDDVVTLTTKVHGTSIILANVLVNRKLSLWEKIKKLFGAKIQLTEYGNVYSSRNTIKNRYVNEGPIHDFYGVDIWGCVNRDFAPYLGDGMTVYGEVAGYLEGSDKMIQKDHDYGCKPGQWKFMPYRITETDEHGNKKEWNVAEVDAWTRNLVAEHPELADKELVPVYMPMVRDRDVIKESHAKAAALIESYLDSGRNVVYLTLGDSTIYCTFSYIQHILETDGYDVELVSGIPSFCAAAARLGTSLTEWNESLHVMPALHNAHERALEWPGNYVLMKSASRMPDVKKMLSASGYDVIAAENCSMENEKLYRSVDEIPDDAGYFTLIIAREKKESSI